MSTSGTLRKSTAVFRGKGEGKYVPAYCYEGGLQIARKDSENQMKSMASMFRDKEIFKPLE